MAYVKAAEREVQIVAAARAVLVQSGVAATTLRTVAAQAGVPLGTLHYVFPTREQLLRAVIADVTDEVLRTVRADVESDRGVEQVLRRSSRHFWHALVEGDVGSQIMQYELALHSARHEAGGLARLQFAQYISLIDELSERAAATAGQRCAIDHPTLARLWLALLDGLIMQFIADPDAERARRDLDSAVDMIIAFADPQPV